MAKNNLKKYNRSIPMYIDIDLFDKIKEKAKKKDMTTTSFIRKLLGDDHCEG